MGLIRWIFAIAILAIWAALLGTGLYVAMYEPPEAVPNGSAIVVVSGNAAKVGAVTGETKQRLDRAVELFNEGKAPSLVVSGGTVTGGDTVAALALAGVTDRLGYVSTAGGAFLEWLEGRTLPGVAALEASRGS